MQSRIHTWSRGVFSFPVMLAALFVVLMVLTVRARLNDPDLWWHLKVGEIIWNTHSIPTADLFSFTTNHHAWTAHEWLAEVSLYGAWKAGGASALMLWLCFFSSVLIITSYVSCSIYSENAKVAFVGGLATWGFATVGLSARPHLIGYLLLTAAILLVHLGRAGDRRWFLLLPAVFAIWVNCHGSFIFGLMILVVIFGCSFLQFRAGLLIAVPWAKPRRDMLAVAIGLSVAALFINPAGVQQVIYPLDVIFHQNTNLGAVSEWQPPTFDNGRDLAFLAVAGVIGLLVVVRRTELHMEEFVLLALSFGMAIRHSRMMFVFGIVAAPILCRLLADTWENYEHASDRRTPNLVMMLLAAAVCVFAFPGGEELAQQVNQANPVKAVEFMRKNGVEGRMLNDYGYGGYLIWAAPEYPVFVDGRADIYDWTGVLKEYGAWATLKQDPNILLDKYRIDFCLLRRNAPMAYVLPYLPGWKLLYFDDLSIIYGRSEPPKKGA